MNPIDLEKIADEFEAGWPQLGRTGVEQFLESNRDSTSLLVELIHADLELRLKAGDAARVESYLDKFPKLKKEKTVVESLLKTEYWIRERLEPDINFSEFVLRFPGHYSCLVRVEGESKQNREEVVPDLQIDRSYVSKRFSMERIQAEGGLGNVWLAHDHELDRKVALKEIKNKHALNPKYQSRFIQEALITGALDHPGVAPVYSLGRFRDGRPYYAMRLIRGSSLREKIAEFHQAHSVGDRGIKKNLAFRRLLQNLLDACHTINFAHSRGIIHRDIKPSNIMIGQYGETLVVDWGLARILTESETVKVESPEVAEGDTIASFRQQETTVEGQAIGSPAFMSPEQARGDLESTGFATDIYSLGASLYNMVTGKTRPVESSQSEGIDVENLAYELRPLLSIARVAMSCDPSDRFQSPEHFAEDIERFLANEPLACHQESMLEKFERLTRRHSRLARTVAIVASLIAILSMIAAFRIQSEQSKTFVALKDTQKARAGEQVAKEKVIAALKEEERAKEAAIQLKMSADDLGQKLVETLVQFGPVNRGGRARVDRLLDMLRERLPEESSRLEVQRLNGLGQYEESLGNIESAIEAFQKALRILNESRENDSVDFAMVRLNLASAHYAIGKTEKSEAGLQVVFETVSSKPEFSSVRVGALSLSAQIERDKNNLVLAMNRARDARELAISTFGRDDFHTQIATDQLAGIHSLLNHSVIAKEMYEELLERQANAGLQDTRAGLTARRNYGVVLLEMGEFSKAIQVIDEVVADRSRMFSKQDIETLDAMMMLGHANYHFASRKKIDGQLFELAIEQLETVFQMHVEQLGIEHLQTGKNAIYLVEAWLGSARFKNRSFEQESERIKRSIEMANQVREFHGNAFSTTNRIDNQVSRYLFLYGKHLPAMKHSQLAVEGIAERYKELPSLLAIDRRDAAILSGHATRCFQLGDHQQAVYWFSRIARNEKRLSYLLGSYLQLKQFVKAVEVYEALEAVARDPDALTGFLFLDLRFFERYLEHYRQENGAAKLRQRLATLIESTEFQDMPVEDRKQMRAVSDRILDEETER